MKDLLRQGLEDYLQAAGRLELRTLGPSKGPQRRAGKEDEARLAEAMREARRSQRRIQWLCVVLLCFVFAVQTGFLIHGLVTRSLLSGTAGGVALVLVPIIWRLLRLGMDGVLTELIGQVAGDLPPEEATKLIEIIYWGLLPPGGRTERGVAKTAS